MMRLTFQICNFEIDLHSYTLEVFTEFSHFLPINDGNLEHILVNQIEPLCILEIISTKF